MPGGVILGQGAKLSAKEAAMKGILALVKMAIRSAVKYEAKGFSRLAADSQISADMRHRQLSKKGDALIKAFEKEADTSVTGLSFSLAVAQVFSEANAFTTLSGDDLLDSLMEMIPVIDMAVDRKYQKYLEKAHSSPDTAIGDFLQTSVGVAENWHQSVTWGGTYKRLQTLLRNKLQAKENAQKALAKRLKGLEAQNTQLIGQLERAIGELKVMIGKFVKADRRADKVEVKIDRAAETFTASSNNFDMVMDQYERLLENGAATWQGKIYRRKDREALQNVMWGYQKQMKAASARREHLNNYHDRLETWEEGYEKHLYKKLTEIRELHWQLWTVRDELQLKNGKKPDRKAKVPRLEIPWRMGDGYPKLRTECYPFTLRVPKTQAAAQQ
ncbi:hypothetical protein [Labrenzia sp. VG12]|uniref:hypothetical protein n=1 Tax=Labrenzia sp. VG12 TaxID=2021862 RepID=UPI0012FD7070|nr:hypothetical protein [Labrenzia sp. VG12]